MKILWDNVRSVLQKNAQPLDEGQCSIRGIGGCATNKKNGQSGVSRICPFFANFMKFALLATIAKAPLEEEISPLYVGPYLMTVPCLSSDAHSCKLSAGPLIAALDLRRLKHRILSVYSCNKAS